eukprot:CAMPEP_0114986612 /NCGR_PEP_ID=MMETSP0216-20121206/8524_1 /TAXON_ID=223996 /ORGANISM="Protocruzia adherens, Strain Boccale" /LENGTH=275 /DNA_ID=CAMNT_0002349069 /DNA_START=115 /DNA_END=942 /DNA_ORIENTATION=-
MSLYLTCTDGSAMGETAIYVTVDGLMSPEDSLVVSHIFDPAKSYLPFNYREGYIRDQVEALLVSRLPKASYSLVWEEKANPGNSTRQQMIAIAKEQHAKYLVVGYHGRKGPKEKGSLLGSVALNSVYYSPCDLVVIKKATTRTDNPNGFLWVVCVDGSEKSKRAFQVTCRTMWKDRDQVHVIISKNVDEQQGTFLEDLRGYFKKQFEEQQVSGYFEVMDKFETTYKTIARYLEDLETDPAFVVVATHGAGNRSALLGSVSEELIQNCKYNIIVTR